MVSCPWASTNRGPPQKKLFEQRSPISLSIFIVSRAGQILLQVMGMASVSVFYSHFQFSRFPPVIILLRHSWLFLKDILPGRYIEGMC